jgi:hypothetical protein
MEKKKANIRRRVRDAVGRLLTACEHVAAAKRDLDRFSKRTSKKAGEKRHA